MLAVAGHDVIHCVYGDACRGVRVDVTSADIGFSLDAFCFPLLLDASLPLRLRELRHLHLILHGLSAPVTRFRPRERRIILALRVIDALAQGASLKSIGEVLYPHGGWPGEGESTKSRVRRLVDMARSLWEAGPAFMFGSKL